MAVPLFLESSEKVECRATFQVSPAIRLSGYQREFLPRKKSKAKSYFFKGALRPEHTQEAAHAFLREERFKER